MEWKIHTKAVEIKVSEWQIYLTLDMFPLSHIHTHRYTEEKEIYI